MKPNMKRFLHILLQPIMLVLLQNVAIAQNWNYIEEGLNSKPTAFCEMDNALVVAFNRYPIKDISDSILVQRWTGDKWEKLPGLLINDSLGFQNRNLEKPRALSLVNNNGILYILVRNYDVPYYNKIYQIYKLENDKWVNIGRLKNVINEKLKLVVLNNKTYCAGNFSGINTLNAKQLISWDGAKWNAVNKASDVLEGSISDVAYHNNALYFAFIDEFKRQSLKYFDGNKFFDVPVPSMINIDYLLGGDELYIHAYDLEMHKYTVLKRDGTGWVNILPNHFKGFYLSAQSSLSWVAFNKGILAVGNFVCGNRAGNFAEYNGTYWKIKDYKNFMADSIYKAGSRLYGFSATKEELNFVTSIDLDFGKIKGVVFKDIDSNCQRSESEATISNMLIAFESMNPHIDITNKTLYAATDSEGAFEMSLPNDSYKVQLLLPDYYKTSSCINSAFVYKMVSNKDTTLSIPIVPTAMLADLAINIAGASSGMKARQGFTEAYDVIVTNIGTIPLENGIVSFKYPSQLKLVKSDPAVSSYTPGELGWKINQLQPDQQIRFRIKLTIPLSVPLNTKLTFKAQTSSDEDFSFSNNGDSIVQEVRAAIDPNNKENFPDGDIRKNVVNEINYTINFQNTGNDYATRVIVTDTFDNSLPLSGVRILAYGPMMPKLTVVNGNVLIWTFNNIMLPDSATDEVNSHGYIKFKSQMRRDLPTGTIIHNKAYITFDYQKPIITNLTRNMLIENDNTAAHIQSTPLEQDEPFVASPNPASNFLVVNFNKDYSNTDLFLIDMLGKVVIRKDIHKNMQNISLDLNTLPQGVYILRTGDGSQLKKIMINK